MRTNLAFQDFPQKAHKPRHSLLMVDPVVPVNPVPPDRSALRRLVMVAVNSGDPALIAAAVAADADLQERAAIREFDGGMSRLDAELAVLLDALDEAGG